MTDDPRSREGNDAEGRSPSDLADARGPAPEFSRPEFLPADAVTGPQGDRPDDGWSQLGPPPGPGRWDHNPPGEPARGQWGGQDRPDPSAQHRQDGWIDPPEASGWGDPSGRPRQDTAIMVSPYGQPRNDGAVFGDPPPPPSRAFGMGPGWAPPPAGLPGNGMAPVGFPGPGAAPGRRGLGTGAFVVLAVVIALIASTLGSVGTYLLTRPSSAGFDPSYTLPAADSGAKARPPESVAGVAAKVLPSVVSLAVEGGGSSGTGSGFLIKGGYVVTNNHVVAAAANGGQIQIQFNNRKSTSAQIIGRDPESDLAVVRPEETFGMPEITLGNSDNVVVGDPVIAIGSPLGLTGTVTTGIVSSLNRPVQAGEENSSDTTWFSAIQTDAAINPGNSGGPLVNASGEVIGVNSAIATLGREVGGQSGSIGLGFAIPVNHARRVAQELVTNKVASKSRIGVMIDPAYQGVGVRIAGSPVEGNQPVTPGGAADRAGLKPGDVILEVNGLVLQDGNELIALVRGKAPGDKLEVKYQRGGQEKTATVVVQADVATPTPEPS
ncbi:trypsin-like peptidase domain-containing protein [Planomonospora sp. ID67723]|uniref:trypsin-like peptidase domain-containing protein n=1 Tax=Planomonospora sp. ID67723 TaxID=2738134 RepID=UPI0018C4434B|nr:trypsin-like peptidase domain-containing protein [Planomonospora sp. ID67723]MBG0833443.1 trypsin-like peptidase domain-containing protein [Planomonospora sp. ID67723]